MIYKNSKVKRGSLFSPFKAIRYLFKKPVTLRYPFETKEPALRYRGFHLNDWDKCTGCGNCADICPNQAIEMVKISELKSNPKKGIKNERPRLDYGRCCFCGLCVDICPAGALTLSRDYIHISTATDTFTFIPRNERIDSEDFLPDEKYSIFQAGLSHRKKNYEGFSSDLNYSLFEPQRVEMQEVKPETRRLSFIEQVIGYSREEAIKESSRCLECGLCEDACPAHLKISDYIKAIHEDDCEESLKKIFEDNPLPSICGRICMKHCEAACSLGIRGEPVAIRWLKRFVADSIQSYTDALKQRIAEPTGKKIAVIGAGPAGLSLAYFMKLKGYDITVFDSLPGAGGMMRIGPPVYRLPMESVDKDVDYIASLGVIFRFNTTVGKDILFEEIKNKYDAVFIGIGTTKSRSTGVKNADRCLLALPFLQENKMGKGMKVGREIIVIGGGNVAMDVAREALRLQNMQYPEGKASTKTVSLEDWDIMPASKEEIEEAKSEGVEFNPGWGPREVVLNETGKVKGLQCVKVKSVFNEQGRFAPTFYEDKNMFLQGDMIIEAIGQGTDFSFIPEEIFKKIEFTERRKVKVDENGMTSVPGIFAGGDIVNTNLDAVTAIADAKSASEGMERYLRNSKPSP
jgi:glutamate synthase (NADPH) small chain